LELLQAQTNRVKLLLIIWLSLVVRVQQVAAIFKLAQMVAAVAQVDYAQRLLRQAAAAA
jgi:hypothetical protein